MESNIEFSLQVSRALDCLGKSQNMVKFRIEKYKEQEKHRNSFACGMVQCIIAGSKGEGLTAPYESDLDIMTMAVGVICADNPAHYRNINDVTVLEADRRNTSPGYTKLRLDKFGDRWSWPWIGQSLFKDCDGQLYISSVFSIEILKVTDLFGFVFGPNAEDLIFYRSGPSQTIESKNGTITQDHVLAYHYNCPEIIQSFIARPRVHEWPTHDQLSEIEQIGGHVVPVGYKGSPTAFSEWRICYTKAENVLMCSLNITQTKTYILLKMVSKTYINFVCKEITSYVLKNVVLWLSESCYLECFIEELLVDRLIQALNFLRNCVINNNLPSYMIPERNLFSGKLDITQRQKLVFLLAELIESGGGLLLGCERLRGTMLVLYKEPTLAKQYRCRRDVIEKGYLWITSALNFGVSVETLLSDEPYYKTIRRILVENLLPDKLSLVQQGHDDESLRAILLLRRKKWLS